MSERVSIWVVCLVLIGIVVFWGEEGIRCIAKYLREGLKVRSYKVNAPYFGRNFLFINLKD